MDKIISVKDKLGNVYTMPSETDACIIAVNYCTSYLQFEVQDSYEGENGNLLYPTKNIYVPLNYDEPIDWIAIDKDEIGEVVKGMTS